ncbi:MAG: hypothetical protein AB7T10_00965 [bacterium]
MKRLLTLFLVIGVLGVYGQTIEGAMQIETQAEIDTTQQVDTIVLPDTIDVKELQIEYDTASSIKDSLFTRENKIDQEEENEKKENLLSCCCLGEKKEQRKSNFSIGYTLGVYPRILWAVYGGEELRGATDGFYIYGNWVCLFHGIEISHNLNLIKRFPMKLGYSYEYSNSFNIVNLLHVSEFNSDYEISHYHGLNSFTFHSISINAIKDILFFRIGLSEGVTILSQKFNSYFETDEGYEQYGIEVSRKCFQSGVNAGLNLSFFKDRMMLYLGLAYKMYFQFKSNINYPNIIYKVDELNPKMLNHTIKISYNF